MTLIIIDVFLTFNFQTALLSRLRPLFDARARIVRGDADADAAEGKERRDPVMDGVPMFWAHAMLSSRTLRNIVQVRKCFFYFKVFCTLVPTQKSC